MRVIQLAPRRGQRHQVGWQCSRVALPLPPEVPAATPLEQQHGLRDRPAVVHRPDDVVVGQLDVVEELLAELGASVDLPDAPDRHALRADRDGEPGQPAVLGRVPVSPGQAHAVVRVVGATAPDLGPVEDPPAAFRANGLRPHAGQVRARLGIGEELHEQLIPGEHPRNVPRQQDGRAVNEHRLGAHAERGGAGHAEVGEPEIPCLGAKGVLVLAGQSLAAVLGGPGDARVARLVELALQ